MDSSKRTREQAQRIVGAVGPTLDYVCKLAHRMQRLGWKANDPLYVAAWQAYDGLHALHIHAHYVTCGLGGAGKPAEPPAPAEAPEQPQWMKARDVDPEAAAKSQRGEAP